MDNMYLLDYTFLKSLDEWNEREIFIKIISLDFNENPRSEIQGYATGGSVKVDGSAALRRVCSLNMIAENAQIRETDWALESKFKLEIGLRNFINPNYDNIIWFPQGIFILTSFGFSLNGQGVAITLQGKDKMCLLDGSIGGNIFASHDFGKLELQHDDGTIEFEKILIYDVIKNAIHEYAFEPYENIVITDLEDCSVELLQYRVKNMKALIYNIYESDGTGRYTTQIAFENNIIYPLLTNLSVNEKIDTEYGKLELIKNISYGDTIGYRLTDLTYAGDLILGAGSAITQMLDALVKMLGEFEYFYDLDGRFVFQRKKIYYNVSWTNAITNERETRYDSIENSSSSSYEFSKGVLIEAYNNKPNLTNIKNDYTIWGQKTGTNNVNLPIHLRCAIDDKPTYYYPLLNGGGTKLWATSTTINNEYNQTIITDVICDWRELIYQMAYDYSKSDEKIAELTKLISNAESEEITLKDDQGQEYKTTLTALKHELTLWEQTWNTNYIAYYTDLLGFWRILYDLDNNEWAQNYGWNPEYIRCKRSLNEIDACPMYDQLEMINPENFIFWLDFLEDSYLEKYKIANIGRRTKVVNDTEVKAIFFEGTPNVLFIDPNDTTPYTDTSLSYARLNITGGMQDYFLLSTQGKSAKDVLDNLIYQHTYYCETITLNCIPIYYLKPNVRISVFDTTANINGEYIIKSFNLPLAYNGSMSITANKAEDLML